MNCDLTNMTDLYLKINEKALNLKKVEFAQYPSKPVCSKNKLREFCKNFSECKSEDEINEFLKRTPKSVLRKFVVFAHMAMDAVDYENYKLLPHDYKNWWEVLGIAVLDFFEHEQSRGKIPLKMFTITV